MTTTTWSPFRSFTRLSICCLHMAMLSGIAEVSNVTLFGISSLHPAALIPSSQQGASEAGWNPFLYRLPSPLSRFGETASAIAQFPSFQDMIGAHNALRYFY
ncbi:hypothetical protein F5879DRAFT_666332 [Lentinula edodes]|nr:hypothetical protein F5879DRAFT_666332 [Lentinula edodes]